MFYISASALKNYISCKNQYYLMNYLKVDKPMTIPMALGTGIHTAIENYDDTDFKGMYGIFQREFLDLVQTNNLQIDGRGSGANVLKSLAIGRAKLKAYCKVATDLAPLTYPKEYQFKVKLYKDLTLVGKIDQIREDGIYDIKTGEYPPFEEQIKKDLQFTIYAYAYEQLFKRKLEGLYWFLLSHKEKKKTQTIDGFAQVIEMRPRTTEDFDEMKNIIVQEVQDIKDQKFWPEYGYQCRTCLVKDFCIK